MGASWATWTAANMHGQEWGVVDQFCPDPIDGSLIAAMYLFLIAIDLFLEQPLFARLRVCMQLTASSTAELITNSFEHRLHCLAAVAVQVAVLVDIFAKTISEQEPFENYQIMAADHAV